MFSKALRLDINFESVNLRLRLNELSLKVKGKVTLSYLLNCANQCKHSIF